METIVIIEDEPDLARILEYNLRQAGFDAVVALDGETGLALARDRKPALVVLDLMLPDMSGLDVCRQLRRDPATAGLRIVMLTAKGEELDRIAGFEVGADDYVTKPFSVREFVLRVGAVLRRGAARGEPASAPSSAITIGSVTVDPERHECVADGRQVRLTALELRLLHTLMARAGRVQTRETLLTDVWSLSSELETRTVDTHMKRLREKLALADDPFETVRGVGYLFRAAS